MRVANGSSPRMRGTGGHAMYTPPAHSVHPRACGEREADVAALAGEVGSSPRLRGTDSVAVFRRIEHRFIPAPAGNG